MATTDPTAAFTTERELTVPVDLCTPDGHRLNPEAKGWSRHLLHRANLRGVWGRNKAWDYWAVLTDDLVIAVTFADIDYGGLVNVEWAELGSGRKGGRMAVLPLGMGVALPEHPGSEPLRFRSHNLTVDIVDIDDDTRLLASWSERDGTAGHLDIRVGARSQESLNVVIPWSDKRFQFTSKHQARPAVGTFDLGRERRRFSGPVGDGEGGVEAWGVLDVGRGRWPYRTRWNWGGGAGPSTRPGSGGPGPVVGLQFGGKWTEGTGFTENGVLLDGRLLKIGDELDWDYSWDDPMRPWRVAHRPSGLEVTLTPVHDRHARANALVLFNEVHQVFGRWTGTVPDGRGGTLSVEGILGFAEESRSRW